jgi:hypothetical protein
MRTLVGYLLVAAGAVALAQTPQDLRNRYGEPEVERFAVRPGIGLTVQYGSDHLACQILIEPEQPIIAGQESETRFMSSETVTNILNEIVPLDTRGTEVNQVHMVSGCNQFDITEYQALSITRSTHNCVPLQPERESRATVIYKRDGCRSQK